ncbi:metallophosphoesterase [Castellaniella sp. FW104-16D08]|uniref:metallophosphoesterase n=1 Tax=unclassified Castellaniella TaxID=2617606 RepID=UPI0033157923
MQVLHQRFPENLSGRDFVVGDLHGCLDLFQAELDRIEFDTTRDRIFSVGDLADRGPDSMGCLRLLHEPWFHAVRGNHEDMLLDYAYPVVAPYAYGRATDLLLRNGGRWVLDLDKSEQDELWEDLVPRVAKLPYVITVGEGAARFHVAHAELMTGYVDEVSTWFKGKESSSPKQVLTDTMINDEVLATMIEPLTWGRRLIREIRMGEASEVDTSYGKLVASHKPRSSGLALTYVGHTPLKCMVLHASHLFIDRGAYARKRNSCLVVLDHQPCRSGSTHGGMIVGPNYPDC